MSRTTIAVVAGLMVLGCVVAMLPAQESSRRTATKNRGSAQGGSTYERPSLTPPPNDSEYVPAAMPQTRPPAEFSGSQPFGANNGEQSVAGDPAQPAELNDSQLRSVLKRAKAPTIPEPPAPQSLAPQSPAPQSPSQSASAGALPRRSSSLPPPPPARSAANTAPAANRTAPNVAVAGKSAALKVDIAGPQGVTVGKPAAYLVTVNNESDMLAEDVQVRIALPASVAIQAAQPTNGDAGMQADAQGVARLVWSIPRIAGRGKEQLKLQLVTQQGDGFDLGVEWTTRPASARATIAVKQPQLELSLAGPAEMTFGEEKTFTLSVSNPGSGDAEHVMVSVAAANSPPQQFDAGTIPAGHKKDVPLAVVASQAGTIELTIGATAESGLEARTSGKINVRKAEIGLAIEGPPLKYAGSEATYLVAISNSGTAAADNINLSLALPSGAKYLNGIEGVVMNAGGLKWKIASLAPGGERIYEVKLQLATPGLHRVVVQSQAGASGTTSSTAETEVQAVSDLKLVVNDPAGPLPTGEPAVYELQVMNRGSQAARQVKIIMQFSDGVEPVAYEGCEARIVPGQILCQPLAQLGPGEQATLRVKAKADQAGSHHFRVEVTTIDGDARLVSEGTTRFFADPGRNGSAATMARKPNLIPTPSIPTTVR
jgi:uncharacterized repeat protein (TIGR01451 family)